MIKTFPNQPIPGDQNIDETFDIINVNNEALDTDLDSLFAKDILLDAKDAELDEKLIDIINETALDPNKDPEVTNARDSDKNGVFDTVKERLDFAENENAIYNVEITNARDSDKNGTFATVKERLDFAENESVSYTADPNRIAVNQKLVDDGQDVGDWVGGNGGVVSIDSVNVKVGDNSIKMQTINGVSTFTRNNLSPIDLTKTNSNEVSLDSDYIVSEFSSDDASLITQVQLQFSDDATFDVSNFGYVVLSGIVTGFKQLKFKKSEILYIGTPPDLSNIQSINYRITATAITNCNHQYVQLVKKDPVLDIPNYFQRNGIAEFVVNSGEWYVGLEYGQNVIAELAGNAVDTTALVYYKKYSNFIINAVKEPTQSGSTEAYLTWEIDALNSIIVLVLVDTLELRITENGVTRVKSRPMNVAVNDKIAYTLEKNGQFVSVTAYINDNYDVPYPLEDVTTLNSSGNVAIGRTSSGSQRLHSISITEIAHAHHANIAEVAKSLSEQAYCRVKTVGVQAIPNNVPTNVQFGEATDDNREHFNISSPAQIFIKENGLYCIMCNVSFSANTAGTRTVRISKSGVVIAVKNENATSSGGISIQTACVRYLKKGEYLLCDVTQNSGVTLNLETGSDWTSIMTAVKIN